MATADIPAFSTELCDHAPCGAQLWPEVLSSQCCPLSFIAPRSMPPTPWNPLNSHTLSHARARAHTHPYLYDSCFSSLKLCSSAWSTLLPLLYCARLAPNCLSKLSPHITSSRKICPITSRPGDNPFSELSFWTCHFHYLHSSPYALLSHLQSTEWDLYDLQKKWKFKSRQRGQDSTQETEAEVRKLLTSLSGQIFWCRFFLHCTYHNFVLNLFYLVD